MDIFNDIAHCDWSQLWPKFGKFVAKFAYLTHVEVSLTCCWPSWSQLRRILRPLGANFGPQGRLTKRETLGPHGATGRARFGSLRPPRGDGGFWMGPWGVVEGCLCGADQEWKMRGTEQKEAVSRSESQWGKWKRIMHVWASDTNGMSWRRELTLRRNRKGIGLFQEEDSAGGLYREEDEA